MNKLDEIKYRRSIAALNEGKVIQSLVDRMWRLEDIVLREWQCQHKIEMYEQKVKWYEREVKRYQHQIDDLKKQALKF